MARAASLGSPSHTFTVHTTFESGIMANLLYQVPLFRQHLAYVGLI